MKKENILEIVKNIRKGTNTKIAWHRKCKTKKDFKGVISKRVEAIGRLGIDYNNQKKVIEKRNIGQLPESPEPIWGGIGEFIEYPYLIRHTKTGQLYLRLYNNTGQTPNKVQYYQDGQPVDFFGVRDVLLASEKKEKSGDCFCCKLDDVLSINGQ